MIPQTVYYSQKITDPDGNIHEIGLSGLIEEGESYAIASEQVAELVLAQSEKISENFSFNFDAEISTVEAELNLVESEIHDKIESLGSFTQFAEAHGLDFKPPAFPFTTTQPQEVDNEPIIEGAEAPADSTT